MSGEIRAFEDAFARDQGAAGVRAFWSGRIGLFALLRALGVGRGDRVGICTYTCLGVVEPVVRTGALPAFLDVDRRMNIAPASLEKLVSPIQALIVQHTFGVPAPIDAYLAWSRAHNVPLIEDCCHGPGSKYNGKRIGTFGVGAVFSLEWSKPFSVGSGGLLAINDAKLLGKVDELIAAQGVMPSSKASYALATQRVLQKYLVTPRTRGAIRRVYRMMRPGGTTGVSRCDQPIPSDADGFLRLMPPLQARMGRGEFQRWRDRLAIRRDRGLILRKRLRDADIPLVEADPNTDPIYQRVPIWVKDKRRAMAEGARLKIDIGGWFATPADPITGEPLRLIGYDATRCPMAEEAFTGVVTLPVMPTLPESKLAAAIGVIRDCGPYVPESEK